MLWMIGGWDAFYRIWNADELVLGVVCIACYHFDLFIVSYWLVSGAYIEFGTCLDWLI